MMKETRYVQFPLYLLRGLHHDYKKAIEDIICSGVYLFSIKIQCTDEVLARQIIYWNYRGGMSDTFQESFNSLEWEYVGYDEYYNGFSGASFDPDEEEVSEMIKVLRENIKFKREALINYKLDRAHKFLKLKVNYWGYIRGEKLIEETPDKEPMPMVSAKLLFKYYNNDKSKLEVEQLAAFIGLKSILGQREVCKSNKAHILARMFGYSSAKDIHENNVMGVVFAKYQKRYHMDKLLEALRDHWHFKTYSEKMRGFVMGVGSNLKYETLIRYHDKIKTSSKKKKRKEEIERAEATVRQEQKNNRSTAP